MLVFALAFWGCEASTTAPYTDPNAPDTTGNPADTTGNGSQTSRYGRLYFQNSSTTRWVFTGPVRATVDGVIIADNQSGGRVTGSCKLAGKVDFGRSINLTFIWQGGGSGGTTYKFYTSTDDTSWTETPFRDDGTGWMAARFYFLFNSAEPVSFKFEFDMPEGGRARIPQIKGYGQE